MDKKELKKAQKAQRDQLVDFLHHLYKKELINLVNYDFDYKKEAKKYLKKRKK